MAESLSLLTMTYGRKGNRMQMKLNAVVILLCFVVVACTSKPTDAPKSTKAVVTTAVSYIDSTWELGEVKSCMEQTFKGEDAPILLCSDHAGAAFFMTAG